MITSASALERQRSSTARRLRGPGVGVPLRATIPEGRHRRHRRLEGSRRGRAAPRASTVVFRATSLAATGHTLTIEVTGQQNPASSGAYVVVDAFDITQ